MRKCAILLATLLVGCASSETVYMQNASGHGVKCGPYTLSGVGGLQDANRTAFARCPGIQKCILTPETAACLNLIGGGNVP